MIRPVPRDPRWKPIPWAVLLAAVLTLGLGSQVQSAGDTRSALASALARTGLQVTIDDVVLIDPPSAFGQSRALVRAWHPGEPADIYLARGRFLPGGVVLGDVALYDLTATPLADEGKPQVVRGRAVLTVREGGQDVGVRLLDLRGELPLAGEWTWLARMQNALTNLQQTGQTAGVESLFWAIEPPSSAAVNLGDDDWVHVTMNGCAARLPPTGGDAVGTCSSIVYRPAQKARPGNLVTWAVDRVRAFPWFGDERMQLVKAVAFDVLDLVKRTQASVLGDDSAAEIAQDLGDLATRNPPSAFTDPETGWPPPPMEPFLRTPLEGEGQWIALENDPFIQTAPGLPPVFVTSYIRTDRERSYTRIYVTMWDPRVVELHMMAGSVEPKGATGEAGPGLIPRTPETMKRLVGACNGGFQALHGEFGMMGDGIIYLPPKPFAATVMQMQDGSTGFGSWPKDTMIPPEVRSYRQNLTVLVLDGKINPYKRGWWGGTPPDWEDRVHSTRSGICLTKEGFVAFFYGNEIDVMPLAQAMVQARCSFGMHLDMNPGHTGLEFYKVAPTGTLPELGRPLDKKWEAEGPVEQMEGWTFRARRMVRFMGLMNFPRYIQREARDFFYMTLRPLLPGEDLAPVIDPPLADEGKWRTKGLPQHGFPFAVATTTYRPDAARPGAEVFLLKVDPRMVAVRAEPGKRKGPTVVSFLNSPVEPGKPTLWMSPRAFSIGAAAPGAMALVSGVDPGSAEGADAVAAVGVQDDEGMMVYAEVRKDHRPGADAAMLTSLLDRLGCTAKLLLTHPWGPDFESATAARGRVVELSRIDGPGGRRIFQDTPIVEPDEWGPLQARRIRYFKKPKQASTDTADHATQ